jgi:hypothetical protein
MDDSGSDRAMLAPGKGAIAGYCKEDYAYC